MGDACTRCEESICSSVAEGFGRQTPYTRCLCCKRRDMWARRSSREGYLQYITSQMRSRARANQRACSIGYADLVALWEAQGGKCALTGLPLMHTYARDQPLKALFNASVDRIDSSRGYVEGNVQLVAVRANLMKGDLPEQSFVDLCRMVVRRAESREAPPLASH